MPLGRLHGERPHAAHVGRIRSRLPPECKLLLDNGAGVNARNDHARTALLEAAMSVRFHSVDPRGAMQRDAHVNAYDKGSWTALTECAHYEKRKYVNSRGSRRREA